MGSKKCCKTRLQPASSDQGHMTVVRSRTWV
jgi:hypothetical protein